MNRSLVNRAVAALLFAGSVINDHLRSDFFSERVVVNNVVARTGVFCSRATIQHRSSPMMLESAIYRCQIPLLTSLLLNPIIYSVRMEDYMLPVCLAIRFYPIANRGKLSKAAMEGTG